MTGPGYLTRFVAIDWSGAKGHAHRGIALAACDAGDAAPALVSPPDRVWSRAAVLDWLIERRDEPMLVGFDFSFSAPFADCGAHLPDEAATPDAPALWACVDAECDDIDLGAVSFLDARRGRHFYFGSADGEKASYLRYRVCETQGPRKPSTVFDAIGASQVAKGSFAGMRLLHRIGGRIPVWPFNPLPSRGAIIVEIYTAVAARAAGMIGGRTKIRDAGTLDAALARLGSRPHTALAHYDDHATDAILTAAWLRANVHRAELWSPHAMTSHVAATEGWTFGVP